jgi:hypothetical protein
MWIGQQREITTMSTYTTYSGKKLGGLVVECKTELGTERAVLRSADTATIYYRPNGSDRKYNVHRFGKRGFLRAKELLAAAESAR